MLVKLNKSLTCATPTRLFSTEVVIKEKSKILTKVEIKQLNNNLDEAVKALLACKSTVSQKRLSSSLSFEKVFKSIEELNKRAVSLNKLLIKSIAIKPVKVLNSPDSVNVPDKQD